MTFDEIVEHFGSQAAMADALGVDRAAVSQWRVAGLPPFRAIQIETITRGKFRAVRIVGVKVNEK